MLRKLRPLLTLAALVATCGVSWGSWVNRNPGAGGAFTQVAPGAISGYVYVACDIGGAAMTRDGGATWHAIGSVDSLNDQNCYAIAADPFDTSFVYIGAEDSLYVSTDGGATFDGKFFNMVPAIGICHNNPSIIYCSAYAGGGQAYKSTSTMIYQSADHGVTWLKVSQQNIPNTRFLKIIPDPVNPTTVYALSYPDFAQLGCTKQIYKSINAGYTWSTIGPTGVVDISDFSLDQAHPTTIYATVYTDNQSAGVYRSLDAGLTWLKMTATQQKYRGTLTTATSAAASLANALSSYASMHDADDNTYLESETFPQVGGFSIGVGTAGLTVGGMSVTGSDTARAISYVQPTIRIRALNPASGSDPAVSIVDATIFVSDGDTRIGYPIDPSLINNLTANITLPPFYGDPSGNAWNWARLATLNFQVEATFSGSVIGPDTYTIRATECGLTVNGSQTTIYVNDPKSTGVGANDGVAGAADSMFYSINQGATWNHYATTGWGNWWKSNVDNGYSSNVYGFCKTFASDPNSSSTLWQIGTQFITKSTNSGQTFSQAFADVVGSTYAGRGIDNVEPTSCAAAGSNIYAGYYDLGIWRSVDAGVHWANLNQGIGWSASNANGGAVLNILVDPSSTSKVWVTDGVEVDQAALWWSSNAGSSWSRSTGVLGSSLLLGLCMDSLSTVGSRKIYLSRNGSLLRSTDDGHTFAPISGPSTLRCVAAKGDTVVAGGEGGLWRCNSITAASPIWVYLGFTPTTGSGGSLPGTVGVQANWNGLHDIKIIGSKMIIANYACSPSGCVLAGGFWEAPLGVASGQSNFQLLLQTNYARQIAVAGNGDIYMSASDGSKAGGLNINHAGGLVKSSDAMVSWTDVTAGLPWPMMAWPICIDPAASAWVLVGNPGTGFWKGP